MAKPLKGFLEIKRLDPGYREVGVRIQDFEEVEKKLDENQIREQSARCMDCGIPFCHGCGCPLGNLIPEFNELVYAGHWKDALDILYSTNNFPEFTGRICPALCEAACTAGLNDKAVSIRQIELSLIEKGYLDGLIKPNPPSRRSGRRIAIVGSGPAGLAAADQLNHMGHSVTVYEQDRKAGGYLRYGIPDFKLDKKVVKRRLDLMEEEGVVFELGVNAGSDISIKFLTDRYDAVLLACGSRDARNLQVPGRELAGIHFALELLKQQNMKIGMESFDAEEISAQGCDVLVVGGGDTGSDCIGTSVRQKARSITQIEILPKPPENRPDFTPWPNWPFVIKTSSSHEEGCSRFWNLTVKSFEGRNGRVEKANLVKVEWECDILGKPLKMKEIPGSEYSIKTNLVLLAMGFTGPVRNGLLSQLELEYQKNGSLVVDENYMTPVKGIFAAGDIVYGPSLVVRAIASARAAAEKINSFLN